MFDVGGPEFLFLLVLALLVFGPRRLPQMGRKLGGFVGEMRRSLSDFRGHLEREVAYDEMRSMTDGLRDVRKQGKDFVRDLMDVEPRKRPSSAGRPAELEKEEDPEPTAEHGKAGESPGPAATRQTPGTGDAGTKGD
jgi:sec-independent protein translocase protein TatB